ncbi:MAG TPA: EAL domain-containing protein [Noviherbaspirillum sp.]
MRVHFSSLRAKVFLAFGIPLLVMTALLIGYAAEEAEDRLSFERERVRQLAVLITIEQNNAARHLSGFIGLLGEDQAVRAAGGAPATCQQFLAARLEQAPGVANLGIVSASGELVCSAVKMYDHGAVVRNAGFRHALVASGLATGEPIFSRATGETSLPLYKAIRKADGSVDGAIFALMDLGWLSRTPAQSEFPPGARVGLLQANGMVVARHPDIDRWAGRNAADTAFVDAIKRSGGNGVVEATGLDGVRRVYALAPFTETVAGQLTLWVGVPIDTIGLRSDAQFIVAFLIALLLLLLTAAGITLGGNRLFVRPVETLVAAMKRLGQGDLSVQSGLADRTDELGALGTQFDAMVKSMRAMRLVIRAGRSLSALKAGAYVLSYETDEARLVEGMCQALVKAAGYRAAWVKYARLKSDEGPVLAGWGLSGTALQELDALWSKRVDTQWRDDAHQFEPIVLRDVFASTDDAALRRAAENLGFQSVLTLPLVVEGRKVGSLSILAAEPASFETEEVTLLSEAAIDVAYGLATQRANIERERYAADLRHKEKMLRESLVRADETMQRLNNAQRIGRIGDWDYNLKTGMITWSDQVYEMYERDPALGPPATYQENLGLYSPHSREVLSECVARAVHTGEPQHYELCASLPSGRSAWHYAVAIPHRDAQGDVASLSGIVQDITERKQSEQAMLRRLRQTSLIAKFGKYALATTDLEAVVAEAASVVAQGLDVTFSKVLQFNPLNRSFVLKAGAGWEPTWIGEAIFTPDETRSQNLFVLNSSEPVIVDDFDAEARFERSDILVAHRIISGIDVSIGTGGNAFGVLGGYSPEPHKFGPDDASFMQSIANTLYTAIERAGAQERLSHLAQYDALTDLPNRLLLKDRLQVALAKARRIGKKVALMFLDLDHFKNVNDSLGHDFGDELLKEAANRLRTCVRSSDTVSRQGGDEFLVVLPEVESEKEVARVAEKLVASIGVPFNIKGSEIILTASIGIACAPDNGDDVETLMRNADAAMYVAKDIGRNRYQFYSSEMNSRAYERLSLEADMRRALEREEFVLEFQPQVALADLRVVGLEALVRWRHPVRGMMPPGQFISIAEDSGLIIPIGTWVLEAACRQHAQWVANGETEAMVAVNVSAQQFRQPGFVPTVVDTLRRTGLPAKYLELEVTESVVMHGAEVVREKLESLNKLGVRLALDDFGTGYSSLSYLKQFPIHRLKIDKSFVAGLPGDQESGAIAQAIISLGHNLGMNVIAEGVESEEQASMLLGHGCDDGQGYLFAPSLSAEDCQAYLQTSNTARTLHEVKQGT